MTNKTDICPKCNESFNRFSNQSQEPVPNAIFVCLYCREILMLNDDLDAVLISEEMLAKVKNSSQWEYVKRHVNFPNRSERRKKR